MITLIDAEKAFDKIQHLFTIKTLKKKNGNKKMCLNITKAIQAKSTANIILVGEGLKVFPLRSRTRQGSSPLLFNTALKSSSHSNQAQKISKRHPNWKGRSKIVCVLITQFYIQKILESTKKKKKLLDLTNKVS
uniref:Reverse transcriptase domain-containing protein n=1 Tax=Canis lupus familiaris TaxID=9615 RepID=A0A8I3PWV6_CANLF